MEPGPDPDGMLMGSVMLWSLCPQQGRTLPPGNASWLRAETTAVRSTVRRTSTDGQRHRPFAGCTEVTTR